MMAGRSPFEDPLEGPLEGRATAPAGSNLVGSNIVGGHIPVMLRDVTQHLNIKSDADAVYVDATFGAGGYSRAILEASTARVIAIDRDPDARAQAEKLVNEFGDRLDFCAGRFGDMEALVQAAGFSHVDGVHRKLFGAGDRSLSRKLESGKTGARE